MRSLIPTILVISLILGVACVPGKTSAPPKTAATEKPGAFPEVPRVTKKELRHMLTNPDVIVLDCRPVEQWRQSPQKIPGAVYADPHHVDSWAHGYPKDKILVMY
jgi:3-mercaptopyruvate sulfurtransferase SseA